MTPHRPAAVFACWADPASWPDWDRDVAWVKWDSPARLGGRGRLKPHSGPSSAFIITVFEQDRVLTTVSGLPGARLEFEHLVHPVGAGSKVEVTIRLAGPLSALWNRLIGRGLRGGAERSLDGLLVHLDG